MKKFMVSIGIMLVLFVSLFSSVYASGSDINICGGCYDSENKVYTINYEIDNLGGIEQSVIAVFSVYDENDILRYEKHEDLTLSANETLHKRVVLEIDEDLYKTGSLKIMLLKDFISIMPLSESVDKSFSDIPLLGENEVYNFTQDRFINLGNVDNIEKIDGMTIVGKREKDNVYITSDGRFVFPGAGDENERCIKLDIKGRCRIDFWIESSKNETRYLRVFNKNDDICEIPTLVDGIQHFSLLYDGDDNELFITSKKNTVVLDQMQVLYDYDDDEEVSPQENNVFYARDYSSLKSVIGRAENFGGGTVYINADIIQCENVIRLRKENACVTISGGDGYKAILDFDKFRSSLEINQTPATRGFRVTGSKYILQNMIIQNAPGSGINLSDETCHDNIVRNIVGRYNDGPGVSAHYGANNNLIENFYAYRNCDVFTYGGDADGLAVNISTGDKNRMRNCYSWENSDDGFDLFANYNNVVFENCAAWHNGDPNVFSGKYDYERGRSLDENLRLVKIFMEYDESFKTNYENKNFALPSGEFIKAKSESGAEYDMVDAETFLSSKWAGNPNGFKLGSGDSKHGPKVDESALRTLNNCIVFDHMSDGVDRNNSSCTVYINNCLAYDNQKRNYYLNECKVMEFINAMSYNGKNSLPSIFSAAEISTDEFNRIKAIVDEDVIRLENMVYNDEIPKDFSFRYSEIFSKK